MIQKWYPCLRNLEGRLLPFGPIGLEKLLARGISSAPLLGWKQRVCMHYITNMIVDRVWTGAYELPKAAKECQTSIDMLRSLRSVKLV